MATQQDYTAVANALVKFFNDELQLIPGWERSYIPVEKIPEAAGATAKVAVDALDAFRAKEPTS